MLIKSKDLFTFLRIAVQEKQDGITDVFLPNISPLGQDGQAYFGHHLDDNAVLDSFRTIDPLKILFYLARERMTPAEFAQQKRVILGVKACDLAALELLDRAMINQDFIDPAYKHWRENSIIVATDCASINETCHCTLVGGKPFAESGFDLNLSSVNGAYFIQVGSDKGEALLQLMKKSIKIDASNVAAKNHVEENRRQMTKKVESQNADFVRQDIYSQFRSMEKNVWDEASKACIGCGACTHICPTCYCLILNDESEADNMIKVRSYDSCQLSGYATVAGGGTPRQEMGKRFRNRYLCKFDYMKHDFDKIACTGCGRCTEACAGGIDFRRVVQTVEQAVATA
jgi:sulfhydrogenase subunit beta (sulfur reductase)